MKWYDNIEFKQPQFLDDMKSIIENRNECISQKKKLANRLVKARSFFMSDNISKKDLQRSNELLLDITTQLVQLDSVIENLDAELVSILEKQYVNMNASMTKNESVNSLGEATGSLNIDTVTASPSDMYLFKTIKELFNIGDNDIEFK